MSQRLSEVLSNLGFAETVDVVSMTSIAGLFAQDKRCGIYVLHFANDELYAGQAINVARRFTQHIQNYNDIVKVSFQCVELPKLDEVEQQVIKTLEKQGFHIRNKVYTSITYAPSLFDDLMPRSEQEFWLSSTSPAVFSGERLNDLDLRRKYQSNFERFIEKPIAHDMIDVLRTYIRYCIPDPLATEMYYWSVSCLPKSRNTYARINIYQQEVFALCLFEQRPIAISFVASSPLRIYERDRSKLDLFRLRVPVLENFYRDYHVYYENGGYSPGGQDQLRLEAHGGIQKTLAFLQDPNFIHAARLFNLRLMRKGTNLNYRTHCFDLADQLLS